jgi:hypothetical protein
MLENDGSNNKLVPKDGRRSQDGRSQPSNSLQSAKPSPLEIAGQIANRAAGQSIFQRYLSEKSANTIKRQARDLELLAEYLIDAQIPLENGANFQTNPNAWHGVTWGIVEGFTRRLLHEGYAVSSVNAACPRYGFTRKWPLKPARLTGKKGCSFKRSKAFPALAV